MSVMDELRAGTRPQHEKLHQVVDLTQMTQTRDLYARMLQRYLRAVAVSEYEVQRYLEGLDDAHAAELDWTRRLSKTRWLEDDLQALGHSPETNVSNVGKAVSETTSTITRSRLLGTTYVMEGMTLGADRMVGTITDRLQVTASAGARFFSGYGTETGAMWKQFRAWGAELEVDEGVAVETAQRVFKRFEICLAGQTESGVVRD